MRWVMWIEAVWWVMLASGMASGQDMRVKTFGATGNGTTVDRAAVQSAVNSAKAAGGGVVVFEADGVYNLGNLGTALQSAIEAVGLRNVTIEGNNAEIVVHTVNGVSTEIFNLIAPSNVRIQNLRFRDAGADVTAQWRGAVAVRLLGADSVGDQRTGRVLLDNLHGTSLLALLQVGGDSSARLTDIAVRDCRVDAAYYGINCQNNGDGLRASGFRCHKVRRPYFVYGVEDHDVEVSVTHDGTPPGQDTACLIKCYDRDTRGIKLRARFGGSTTQYVNAVTLEHQRGAGPGGLIGGIDLGLEIDSPGAMVPVRFRSYRDTGPGTHVEETATANRWDRITIGGNLATTAASAIAFGSIVSQGAEGRMTLLADVAKPQSKQPHYPGFVLQTGHGREVRTVKGDLATRTVVIPLAGLDAVSFELLVTTWLQEDTAAVGLAKRTVIQDVVFAQNAGGAGVVSVKCVENVFDRNWNGPATVSYAGDGENLKVSFGGYTGSNGIGRVMVEHISRGP